MRLINSSGVGLLLLLILNPVTLAGPEAVSHSLKENGKLSRRKRLADLGGTGLEIFRPGDVKILEGIGMLFGVGSDDISSIISLVKLGLGLVDIIDRIFSKVFNGTSFNFEELTGNEDRDMLAMFEVITYRLEQMQLGIQGIESSLRDMVRSLPNLIRWEVMLDSLEDYTKPINSLYHRFSHYQLRRDKVENHTLQDFAESVVSHETDSIMNLMASVHSMVAPDAPPSLSVLQQAGIRSIPNKVSHHYNIRYRQSLMHHFGGSNREEEIGELSLRPSVFVVLGDVLKSYDRCNRKQTPQQMILGLYSLVALTQARGFAMINFSYMLLRLYGKGNFTVEQDLSKRMYEEFSLNALEEAKKAVNEASNVFQRCDPEQHRQGETYVMLTELLQAHIENEVDMNERGTCLKKCGDYQHSRVFGCFASDKQVCGKRKKCKGTLHHCSFINADADVCFSSNPYRRYDWIHYENGRTLGDKDQCRDLQKVDSWWRWFVHCSYCICLCDDPTSPTTDRYVSLVPTETNLDDSMVVTGVRFTKHNRVLMIEVQQGRTMPQGQVDPSTLEWMELPRLDVNNPFYQAGKDYQILSYEVRNMDLDNLKAPTGHVITGVKFRMLGTHVNLEVKVTPVNFTTGALKSSMSYWSSKDNTPLSPSNNRKELKLYRPKDPAKISTPNDEISPDNTFVVLQATDLESDVSQMTVPYFDALPVTTTPACWTTGLNLHHKGRKGSGGFITFSKECYNATRHLESPVEIVSLPS